MDYENVGAQATKQAYDRPTQSQSGSGLAPPLERPALEIAFNRLEGAKEFLQTVLSEFTDRLTPVLHPIGPSNQAQEKRPHMGAPLLEAVMMQADFVEAKAFQIKELISRLAI